MQLVSIIVPVYNAEKYLSDCLDSLINQTYKDIEIICINDGSQDNSYKILEEYAEKDKRIKLYNQENAGASETRNRGISYATGDYIMFIDSDDSCSLDSVETSVKIAEKEDADLVVNFMNVRHNQAQQPINKISYLVTWQIFVKRELLLNYPNIRFNTNLKMGEDAVFSHKLLAVAKHVCKNLESKYNYSFYQGQTMSVYENEKKEEFLSNIKLWYEDLNKFYEEFQLWDTKSEHFLNFLIEQPFTQYIRLKWNKRQSHILKELILNEYNTHKLRINSSQNSREWLFKIFIQDKTGILFNLLLVFSKIYIFYTQIIKIKKMKNSRI